jgi:hypothetical protein
MGDRFLATVSSGSVPSAKALPGGNQYLLSLVKGDRDRREPAVVSLDCPRPGRRETFSSHLSARRRIFLLARVDPGVRPGRLASLPT